MIDHNQRNVPSPQISEVMLLPFRWWMIAYAAAVFIAASAAGGPLLRVRTVHANDDPQFGFIIGPVVIVFWWVVWMSGFTRAAMFNSLMRAIYLGFILAALSMFFPAMSSARDAARRVTCINNLRNIQLALLNYEFAHKAFPPSYVDDADGRPLSSWRMLISKYLDRADIDRLYNFSEPWDSPANRDITELRVHFFSCPSSDVQDGKTTYLAVTGPETAWSPDGDISLDDITDGPEQTVMLLEVPHRRVNWTEPRDIGIDEAVELLSGPRPRDERDFYIDGSMTMADGRTYQIPFNLSKSEAKALFTINAGDEIPNLKALTLGEPLPDYATHHRIAWAVFLVLTFLPAPWAWSRRMEQLRVA